MAVRGRDVGGVIEQYTRFVKPAFDSFVAPSRRHAHVIIPWGRFALSTASCTFDGTCTARHVTLPAFVSLHALEGET